MLDLRDGQDVLDACAAPGGKTGHILETAQLECWAIDLVPKRLTRVQDNLDRLGLSAHIHAGDATQPLAHGPEAGFDRILLDAPCSGTGVIRRHPDIRLARDPQQVDANATVSAAILRNLWAHLKPGGRLVYATCSTLPQENEQLVAEFLTSHPDAHAQPITLALPSAVIQSHGIQILPAHRMSMASTTRF